MILTRWHVSVAVQSTSSAANFTEWRYFGHFEFNGNRTRAWICSKSQLFIHYPQSNIIRWPLMYFSWKDEIIYCFLLVRRCLRTSVGVVVFSFSFSDLYCDGHKSDGGGERGEAPRRPWHGSYQDPCCKVAAAAPGRFAAWQKGHPTPVQCPSIFQGNVTGH